MFDPALVVTWTAVALTGGPPRGPAPVAPLLTALATRIQQQLGTDALRPLQADPDNPSVRAHLQARIERSAFYDPSFTQDLTRLQQDIDEQKLLDRLHLPAAGSVRQALPAGPAAGGAGSGVAAGTAGSGAAAGTAGFGVAGGTAGSGPDAGTVRPGAARAWAPNHGRIPSHVARNPWYSRALITVGTLTSVACLVYLTVLLLRSPAAPLPHLPDAVQTFVALCAGLALLAAGVATSHPTRRR